MEKEKKIRASLRTSFTKFMKNVEQELENDAVDFSRVNGIIEILVLKQKSLNEINEKIYDELLDKENIDQAELDRELEINDGYNVRLFILKEKVMLLQKGNQDEIRSIASEKSKATQIENRAPFKLPLIEFKKFNGELKEWLPFWSLFRKIDEDPLINNVDKFQYLIQTIVPGTKARDLVESFPAVGENYKKVIQCLKDRYGKEDLLIEVYIRELLGLVLQNMTSSKSIILSSLYDKLECQLRALETLNITTNKCAAILLPLVESSLPEDILRAWQRSNFFNVNKFDHQSQESFGRYKSDCVNTPEFRLDQLMKFLCSELENEQKIKLALSGFGIENNFVKGSDDNRKQRSQKQLFHVKGVSTAAELFATNSEIKCVFCEKAHVSQDCFKARKMSVTERKKILDQKRCCYNCLKIGHRMNSCRNKQNCIMCNRRHNVLICENIKKPDNTENKPDNTENKRENTENKRETVLNNENHALANVGNSYKIMLQTLLIKLKVNNSERIVRAIIDTGSQRSYILKSTAGALCLKSVKNENIKHALFGGINTNIVNHKVFEIEVSDLEDNHSVRVELLDQVVICGKIEPFISGFCMKTLQENGIQLTDYIDKPIEVLIGADVAGKLFTGKQCTLTSDLTAIQTKLGWTVMGRIPHVTKSENIAMVVTSLLIKEADIADLWALDVLGITDPCEKKKKEELHIEAEKHFLETVSTDCEGRYLVHLPWIENHPPLPTNYNISLKRLESTMKKLERDRLYDEYNAVFEEWLKEGIIEEVPVCSVESPTHYLPHRPIVKIDSTTKIRPVFDASAKERNNVSLNSCLEKGINLIELIPSILIRFRLGKIGVIADIKKAFLQIGLSHKDRNFLRFLWIDPQGSLKMFQHCRVVFGLSSSPFLLGSVIQYHLKNILERCKLNENNYTEMVIEKLLNCFYVDNCVTSVHHEDELQNFMVEAVAIMREAKFDLRGWEFTNTLSVDNNSSSNVLGLKWNCKSDTFQINLNNLCTVDSSTVTKRNILSVVHRMFDPIGIFCPILLLPKLFLQKMWILKVGWDEPLDDDIKEQFLNWMQGLVYLEQIKISRWLLGTNNSAKYSLHIFCDASKDAYATVIFLRTESETEVNVELVQAKSRVTPVNKQKTLTIPRLELLAANIGVRLYSSIVKNFSIDIDETTFWTDSTTVLAWINREEQWDVFVRNRVKEIKECTLNDQWKHIPGSYNPADLPSRGCNAKKLLESEWWKGPKWLYNSKRLWPVDHILYDEAEINLEKKKSITSISGLFNKDLINDWYYRYFSKYKQVVRLVAWLIKFKQNCLTKRKDREYVISSEEYEVAETKVLLLVQSDTFCGVNDEKLSSLCPFQDKSGIIRLKTKVFCEDYSEDFCHPIVLPNHHHPVVKRLIFDVHCESCHSGIQTTLNILRRHYWILSGRKAVRSVLKGCMICKRYAAKNISIQSPALPIDRVRKSKVFEIIGIDFAGPLYIKGDIKVWICLFTCAVYRAVHLELISSLSTDRFLLCLRKFISKRGRPKIIYTDNGTNFVGAANVLTNIDWGKINNIGKLMKIRWKFNPPSAPWWGGWWERLIGLLKQLLRRVLGRISLDFEELQTVLAECEAVINARPLTYLSDNHTDLTPLSPDMFLKEIDEIGVPDLDAATAMDLNRRVKYRNHIREMLKRRFQDEYLGKLILYAKKRTSRKVKLGELVFIQTENKNRLGWPLGKVVELLPGRDGVVRLVKLQTSSGSLLRPVQRIFPLEMDNEELNKEDAKNECLDEQYLNEPECLEESKTADVEEVQCSRSGRMVKPPSRLDL